MKNEIVLLPRFMDRIGDFFLPAYSNFVDMVCIPSYSIDFLPVDRETIKREGDRFGGLIDFPISTTNSRIRQQMVRDAIMLGYKTVDFTISSLLVKFDKIDKLHTDAKAIKNLADDHGVLARPIIEPIDLSTIDILKVADILQDIGFEYIICGTGSYVWDVTDALIIYNVIRSNTSLKTILCANTLNEKQYFLQENIGVYGIRFTSVTVAESVLKENLINGV